MKKNRKKKEKEGNRYKIEKKNTHTQGPEKEEKKKTRGNSGEVNGKLYNLSKSGLIARRGNWKVKRIPTHGERQKQRKQKRKRKLSLMKTK